MSRYRHAWVAGIIIGLSLTWMVSADPAAAAALTVCASGCQYTTIQSAVDAAAAGDLITVRPGTYAGATITKQIRLEAQVYDPKNKQSYATHITSTITVQGTWAWDQGPTILGFSFNTADALKGFGPFTVIDNYVTGGGDGISFERGGGGKAIGNYVENTGDDCIDVDNQTTHIFIGGNILLNCGQDGLETRQQNDAISSRATLTLQDNIIQSAGEDGIQIMDYTNFSNRHYLLRRNIFIGNGKAAIGIMSADVTNENYSAAAMPEPLYAINNTFVNNDAAISGGGNLIAINNIFQGQTTFDLKNVAGQSKILNSLFAAAPKLQGTNNVDTATTITADPQLRANYDLTAGSPAVDAGRLSYQHTYTFSGQSITDTIANLSPNEFVGSAQDLGWKEYSGNPSPTAPPLTISPDPSYPPVSSCVTKPRGDADCSGTINLADYESWRREYNGESSGRTADFNGSGSVTLADYESWRRTYQNDPSISPSSPLSPTSPISPVPPTTTPTQTASCLSRPGPLTTVSGVQSAQFRPGSVATGSKFDAQSASWQIQHDYPVLLEGGTNFCFVGGTITGLYPYSTTWDAMHSTAAISIRAANITIENLRIHNYGDGIGLTRGNPTNSFLIRGVYFTHIRDDCIENDYMYSGLVEDSLFDGCYTGFSARNQSVTINDGSNNIWEFKNSLIRMEPMEKVYMDRGLIPGHGGFFKWDNAGISPKLSLHNNIFRLDQPPNGSDIAPPPGKLVSCSNNTMVWLGTGPFPAQLPTTFNGQPCYTLTTDRSVWDNAVAAWKTRHGY